MTVLSVHARWSTRNNLPCSEYDVVIKEYSIKLESQTKAVSGITCLELLIEMIPGTIKNDAHKSGPRLLAALLLSVIVVAGSYAAIQFLLGLADIPYNVHELFGGDGRHFYVAVFSVLLVWVGFGPAWIADFIVRHTRCLPFLPIWSSLVGMVSWLMLRACVTSESLWDIVGSPTLGWGGEWELTGRFLALHSLVCLTLLVVGITVGGVCRLGWRRGLKLGSVAVLFGMPWLVLAWMVVVKWAGTDNLTELIRAEPFKWTGPMFLAVLISVIAANASVLTYVWLRRGLLQKLASLGLTLLLVTPGWALLYLGLDPAVKKYNLTFPAIRFLLGPDRQTEISWSMLFFRWGALQLTVVTVLAVSGIIAVCLRPRHRSRADVSDHHD